MATQSAIAIFGLETLNSKVIISACILLAACSKQQTTFENSGAVMGTTWNSTYSATDNHQQEISDALNQVDSLMSTYKPNSEISRFSKSTNGVEMSAPSFYVISTAIDIAKKTNGAFDPTIMPIVNIWGFGPNRKSGFSPTNEQIAKALGNCGWQHLQLSTDSFFVGKDIQELELDLSAIAKGYGADHAAMTLEMSGVHDYMIEVGGEIRVKGQSPKMRPWRLAIDSPNENNYARVIELANGAIATSGDYRNTRMVDGKLVSHTINPRTGRPVTHSLASVSIVANNCTIADAMATACMVLGAEAGMKLVESTANVEAYFITRVNENEFVTTESTDFPAALNLD